jgi:hypothetical protein
LSLTQEAAGDCQVKRVKPHGVEVSRAKEAKEAKEAREAREALPSPCGSPEGRGKGEGASTKRPHRAPTAIPQPNHANAGEFAHDPARRRAA